MYALKAEDVVKAEANAIASGTDNETLVTRASRAICDFVSDKFDIKQRVAVFCGLGGNGGDGALASVMLCERGFSPIIYMIGECTDKHVKIKPKLDRARSIGIKILDAENFDDADVIIDAMFGIGLSRALDGKVASVINRINAANAFTLAVDIPSGLNADTGEIMGACVEADATLTFSCYKTGLLFGAGRRMCGNITVCDVGVRVESDVKVCSDVDFAPLERRVDSHKGDSGRVFVIGGSADMVGAPLLAAAAAHGALLSGAGLVTVCMPEIFRVALSARCTLAMMKFLPDTADGFVKYDEKSLADICSAANAIDIGMGMGRCSDLRAIIEYLCDNFTGALVLDADALNALKGEYSFIKNAKCKIVMTPHAGEFVRLTCTTANIDNAKRLASDIGGVAVVKSATTIITDGERTLLNIAGTPAMAKGGTGDVLGGCIAALCCAFDPFIASAVACYRNGKGAERAVSSYAQTMLTPHDILRFADYKEI